MEIPVRTAWFSSCFQDFLSSMAHASSEKSVTAGKIFPLTADVVSRLVFDSVLSMFAQLFWLSHTWLDDLLCLSSC